MIVASIDSDEAFAPERRFAQRLVRSTATIIFIACIAAMLWARLFVRPIKRLEQGAEQISTGDYNVSLPVNSRDEFGDLTVAFNEMSRNLAIKDQLLTEQREENDRLLLSLMPESVVRALPRRRGDDRRGPPGRHGHLRRPRRSRRTVQRARSRGVAGGHQQTGAPVRRRRRKPWGRAGAQHPQRLSGQLRTDRAAPGQHPSHGRFRRRDATDRRPVQRRDRPRAEAAGRHRHRHGHQRTGRPRRPGLRPVGRGGAPGLGAAARSGAAGYLRQRRGLRGDPRQPQLHAGGHGHRGRPRGADLAAHRRTVG